jgi:hypothetical protein
LEAIPARCLSFAAACGPRPAPRVNHGLIFIKKSNPARSVQTFSHFDEQTAANDDYSASPMT